MVAKAPSARRTGGARRSRYGSRCAANATHAAGDWGRLCDDDRLANELALQGGARILSAYEVDGARVWVITEADRSATTALLPSEY